jgi:hypothetical protein
MRQFSQYVKCRIIKQEYSEIGIFQPYNRAFKQSYDVSLSSGDGQFLEHLVPAFASRFYSCT